MIKAIKRKSKVFAICIGNADNPASLTLRTVYEVLLDRDAEREGQLRVIDEEGENYLYPAENFIVVQFDRSVAAVIAATF